MTHDISYKHSCPERLKLENNMLAQRKELPRKCIAWNPIQRTKASLHQQTKPASTCKLTRGSEENNICVQCSQMNEQSKGKEHLIWSPGLPRFLYRGHNNGAPVFSFHIWGVRLGPTKTISASQDKAHELSSQ